MSKHKQCTQLPLWMWCLYVSVHELCAACALLLHQPLFPPVFFLSSILISSHHCHHSFIEVSPLDWIVSLISAYLSLISLFLFSRSHRFPPSFIRSISSMRSRIAAWCYRWFVMMGMYPLHLHLLICSHHDAASVVAMHWVH